MDRIEKLKALVHHPATPPHERETALRILRQLEHKRQLINRYKWFAFDKK